MATMGNTHDPQVSTQLGFSCIQSVPRKRGADPPAAMVRKAHRALMTMPGMTQLTLMPLLP